MASILDTLELGISAIKSNALIAQYAEPVLFAVLTGSGTIAIPEGTISIAQTGGAPAKFTIGTAGIALETFLLTNDLEIQVGTTVITFVPNATPAPIAAAV